MNEGVCEIVDPDEALGKASSQSASPDTKVKFVEAAALNEEDKKLARGFYARVLEYVKARDDAEEARAAAAAAAGAGAGALREARDEVSKLRLRENHWVGLIGCHREAAALSRELAELAALHGGG